MRNIRGVFAIGVLVVFLAGAAHVLITITVEHNLRHDSQRAAQNWAKYFASNLDTIDALTAGDKPSQELLYFFRDAVNVGDVSSLKLFDRLGFLRFVSGGTEKAGSVLPNLVSHSEKAVQIAESGQIQTRTGQGAASDEPAYFAKTTIPVFRNGRVIAIAEIYFDQTKKQAILQQDLQKAGLIIALLGVAVFGIPAAGVFCWSKYNWHSASALRDQNSQLNAVLENMSQGFCMYDARQRLVLSNKQYVSLYSMSEDMVQPGTTLREILEQRIANGIYAGEDPEGYIRDRLDCVEKAEQIRSIHELTDGRTLSVSHVPLPDGGWLTTHDDITELRQYEEHIAYLASFDAVTGIENRSSLEQKIANQFVSMRGEKFAVLCIDLDNFKVVNETLGHLVGDRLLKAVSERLLECAADADTVSRLGGNEFVILQASGNQPDHAQVLAHYVCQIIQEPFNIDGNEIITGASIGIAIAPADGTESEELIKNAGLALSRSKEKGRGAYHFFEAEMDAHIRKRHCMEQDLREALKKGELKLHFQPLIRAQSGEISGCEALLRWDHPLHGRIPPADFIPVAEEIGVIVPIGEWIIRQACREAAQWPESTRIAVNVSAAQFRSGNLVATVVAALASTGLDPIRLELEITETTLLTNNQSTLDTLHMLRSLGVRIAIDDFGTGYSSLSYMRSFPFDKIKLDGSFVQNLTTDRDSQAIIRAVAGLGDSLGITTTAEGVETQEQFEMIRAEGYTEIQGYYFSMPLPADEVRTKYFSSDLSKTSAA